MADDFRGAHSYALRIPVERNAGLEAELQGQIEGLETPLSFKMPRVTFNAPDSCVFCRKRPGTTDEHIIPLMIGGAAVIKNGSCRFCQIPTMQVEDYCARHNFVFGRPHFNITGRRSKHRDNPKARAVIGDHPHDVNRKVSLPLDEHPGIMVQSIYPPCPQILLGTKAQDVRQQAVLRMVDKAISLKLLRSGKIFQCGSTHPIIFGRLIAKIAHAYAAVQAGVEFRPLLKNFILGKDKRHPAYWISTLAEQPAVPTLHTLAMARVDPKFVIVDVGLFSSLRHPVYRVVVGKTR